jgi:hypothetical protein
VARVSLWTLILQTVLDAYYCLFFLTTGVLFGPGRAALAPPACHD